MLRVPASSTPRFALTRLQFLLLTAAWIASVPNAPTVLRFFAAPAAGHGLAPFGVAAGGWLFIFTVTFGMLVLLGVAFWGRAVKALCAATLVAAAALSYFTIFLGTQFDRTMVANIVQTNTTEALELLTWRLAAWVAVVGIVPALAVGWLRLRPTGRWRSAWQPVVAFAALLGFTLVVVYAQYSRHASVVRNRDVSFDTVAPANLLVSSVRVAVAEYAAKTVRAARGVDAHAAYAIPQARLLILVLGETARAQNHGLNGYERDTTPRMRAAGGYYFPDTESCGTATTISVPCIFSGLGRQEFSLLRARESETLIDVVARAKARVIWLDNDSGCKDVCAKAELTDLTGSNNPKWCPEPAECYDEMLLEGLQERLAKDSRDTLVVLHVKGSHGPAYYKRYPPAFARFTPVCTSSDLSSCDGESLRNAYDNSILYTDHVVGEAIAMLRRLSGQFAGALLYVSDHGESLGENGMYLHGLPYAIAPREQTRVPMYAWVSPEFLRLERWDTKCMARQAQVPRSHDNVYATVLGFMEVESVEYQPALDIFDPCDPPPVHPR